jgi:hypothetical protein
MRSRGCYALEEKIDRGVLLFLKKKKQKDFCPFGTERSQPLRSKRTKVLWFFLSRKNQAFLPMNAWNVPMKCIIPPKTADKCKFQKLGVGSEVCGA